MAAPNLVAKKLRGLKPIELANFFPKAVVSRYLFLNCKVPSWRVYLILSSDVVLPLPHNAIIFDFGVKRIKKFSLINGKPNRINTIEPISKREQKLRTLKGKLVYRYYSMDIHHEDEPLDVGVDCMRFVLEMAGLEFSLEEILQFDTLLVNPFIKVDTYLAIENAI